MLRFNRIAAAAVAVLGVGFAGAASAKELVIGTIGITGDTFQLSTAWSNALIKQGGPLRLTPVDGRGTNNLLRMVATNRADLGFIGSPHFQDALSRTGAFQKEPEDVVERYKNLRVLFAIPTGMGQYVVRDDSGIRTFADMKGKSIAFGTPGGNAGRVSTILFQAHGLDATKGDIDGRYIEANTAFDQLSNGQINATIAWGGMPQSGVFNVSRSHKLRFISPEPEKFDAFKSNVTNGQFYVFRKFEPAQVTAAYGDHVVADGPVYFWTFPMMVMVRADMPDDEAYALTKAVWDNIETITKENVQLSLMSFDNALEQLSAQVHPGARKYFEEKGVAVPK